MEENNIEKLPEENSNSEDIKTIISSKDVTLSYFGITASELEDMMTSYKERDSHYLDLKYLENIGGIDSLLKKLKTDKTKGINSVDCRENEFGSNRVFIEPVRPFCAFVLESLEDLMIRILIVAAIVEIVLGTTLSDNPKTDWIDGLSIIIAIVVVVLVGSITNYNKEKKFHELNDIQKNGTRYKVIRNGSPNDLTTDDILVGDLIKINYGDIMPADLILIEGNGIKMDESSLTGESDAVKKMVFEECIEERNNNLKPHSPFILSGTNCIEGNGMGIVIAVGEHSQKGIIKRIVDNAQEDNKTPLEQKLDIIAEMIGWFGMGAAVVTLVALSLRFVIQYIKDIKNYNKQIQNLSKDEAEKLTDPKKQIPKKILDIIILCVSIIVVAIPEGLPLAVTLSLAFSIKKLMDNNNLVRKMHACETMGGANIICTDKTGTLTKNIMLVRRLVTSSEKIEVNPSMDVEIGIKKTKTIDKREEHKHIISNDVYWDTLYSAIALNVDSTIFKLDVPNENGDTETYETKNKTDQGFIEFLYQFKSPLSPKRELFLSNSDSFKLSPFDSKKKRMTTYIKNDSFPTKYRLYTKGGAENATIYCNRYLNKETGEVKDLTQDQIDFINFEINEMNKKMMRTLYICYNDITEQDYINSEKPDEKGLLPDQKNLIFIGIFGLQDSLRTGVKNAVDECHMAGVRVIMVTGDNLITATSIAKDCNILPPKIDIDKFREHDVETNSSETNDPSKSKEHIKELLELRPYAITGNSFYAAIEGIYCKICGLDTSECKCPKSEAEAEELAKDGSPKKPVKKDAIRNLENFEKISANLLVMARSQPLHKYALVLGFKELDNVVAVTGDGTNDAPALSKSDVGFSMNDGTDIAKEASDIILMDNNFTSIVVAIIYGRSIYENIRKFLQFQLTVNFGACILVFLCSCIGNETPLTSIQMLWVNLIMDSLGSLALATEPPYQDLLRKKPTNRNESIINGKMWKHIGGQSLFEIGVLIILYFLAPKFIKEDKDDIKDTAAAIRQCFGNLPGNAENDEYILYGNRDKWVSNNNTVFNSTNTGCFNICREESIDIKKKWDNLTMEEFYDRYVTQYGGTTHMTLIFDVFVCYTLFNQINCRIIDDGFNTFKRISKGIMFIIVTSCELAIQILLSQFGRQVFHCVINGLSFVQWMICLGFAVSTMCVNFIIKIIPLDKYIDKYTKPKENDQQLKAKYARTTVDEIVNKNLIE